jgi:hypothetical protein
MPADQASGLRRLFGAPRRRPAAAGRQPLRARPARPARNAGRGAGAAGPPGAGGRRRQHRAGAARDGLFDLAAGVERLHEQISYLAARGVPLAHVDTHGSAAAFVDAAFDAAPQADVVLLHADPADLARMLGRRAAPAAAGADRPESIKQAYACCKLLAQRCGLMTFDLLLCARRRNRAPSHRRAPGQLRRHLPGRRAARLGRGRPAVRPATPPRRRAGAPAARAAGAWTTSPTPCLPAGSPRARPAGRRAHPVLRPARGSRHRHVHRQGTTRHRIAAQAVQPAGAPPGHQMIAKLPANVELDDLIQVGMIGLSDALSRFDAAQGVQFETFATQRIRGAMLDELRGSDWMSRGDRRQQRSHRDRGAQARAAPGPRAQRRRDRREMGSR